MIQTSQHTDSSKSWTFSPHLALAIVVGAALGALGRETVGFLANGSSAHDFPWGTLIANLSGAFLLGILATYIDKLIRHDLFKPFWEIGFVRSFTTLSTFSLEGVRMLQAEAWGNFFPYVIVSVLGGLLAVFLGDQLGTRLTLAKGKKLDTQRRDRVEKEG